MDSGPDHFPARARSRRSSLSASASSWATRANSALTMERLFEYIGAGPCLVRSGGRRAAPARHRDPLGGTTTVVGGVLVPRTTNPLVQREKTVLVQLRDAVRLQFADEVVFLVLEDPQVLFHAAILHHEQQQRSMFLPRSILVSR